MRCFFDDRNTLSSLELLLSIFTEAYVTLGTERRHPLFGRASLAALPAGLGLVRNAGVLDNASRDAGAPVYVPNLKYTLFTVRKPVIPPTGRNDRLY